jgi:hypothetical protein
MWAEARLNGGIASDPNLIIISAFPDRGTNYYGHGLVIAHGLHERKSRVMLAARLVGKTAAETISVMLAIFARKNTNLNSNSAN